MLWERTRGYLLASNILNTVSLAFHQGTPPWQDWVCAVATLGAEPTPPAFLHGFCLPAMTVRSQGYSAILLNRKLDTANYFVTCHDAYMTDMSL
jgi:hypothetical protein